MRKPVDRFELAGQQAWRCSWCSKRLPADIGKTELDHIIPLAVLPIEERWNYQLLHPQCNRQKQDRMTPEAWRLAAMHGLQTLISVDGSQK